MCLMMIMRIGLEVAVTKIERGKVAIFCPECKEESAGKMKYRAEDNNSHENYYCPLCKEHWDLSEIIQEEYKTAVFKGDDGEWKFIKMTEAKKDSLRAKSEMWNKSSMKRSRDRKGKFAGGMNKNDINMLRRLRK